MKKCPSCKQLFNPGELHQWLPFCSDRCRLLDLGAWLNEEHSIPADNAEIPPETNPGHGPH